MLRASLTALALLALTACVAGGKRPVTFADYSCDAAIVTERGRISVVRWLGRDGALSSTVVIWQPALPSGADGLQIVGRWQALAPERLDFDRGLVMFDQDIGGGKPMKLARFRLELRTHPGPAWEGRARLEGKFPLRNGLRLSADWAEVAAMARGAGKLFLVLADRKGTTSSHRIIPASVFEGFASEAAKLLDQTSAMASEFRTRCQSTATNDIVV